MKIANRKIEASRDCAQGKERWPIVVEEQKASGAEMDGARGDGVP